MNDQKWDIKRAGQDDPNLIRYLDEGWEPFAVTIAGGFSPPVIWLKKAKDAD